MLRMLEELASLVCFTYISQYHTGTMFGAGPRKSLFEQLSRTGYGHNFGEQPGGGPNVQGQLIVQILKPLLDKCVDIRKELQAHENIVSRFNPLQSMLR